MVFIGRFRLFILLLFVIAVSFYGCSRRDTVTQDYFVGKWKSSKLETPVFLYRNGEWEIKNDSGAVLQYGIWEYKNKEIIWRFKTDRNLLRDVNPVLSVTPIEFKIQEVDKTITIFSKLD